MVHTVDNKILKRRQIVDIVNFQKAFNIEKNKTKVDESHQRSTFLIRKDLLEQFDYLANNQKRGFKTHFINYLLENGIEELNKHNRR
jgi:hypothetical protein